MALPENNTSVNHKLFICCTSVIFITILLYPWVLGISLLGFLIGFYLLDHLNDYIQNFLLLKYSDSVVGRNLKEVVGSSSSSDASKMYPLDPLLHTSSSPIFNIEPTIIGVTAKSITSSTTTTTTKEIIDTSNERCTNNPVVSVDTCSVCDEENCPRSDEKYSRYTSPGQQRKHHHNNDSPTSSKGVTAAVAQHNLRMIDERLDKSIANFCKAVFDFYISSNWAPYETRKQLKLAFKKLLTNFADRLQSNLVDDDKAIIFCQDKVIPLVVHYLEKLRTSNNKSQLSKVHHSSAWRLNLEKMANLKTRRLCRQLLETTLPPEDQQCRLWMELCVAVLCDGVLWNLILLGRNKLPTVILNYVEAYTQRSMQNIARPAAKDVFNFICDKTTDSVKQLIRLRCAQSQSSKKCNSTSNSGSGGSSNNDNDGVQSNLTINSEIDSKFQNCEDKPSPEKNVNMTKTNEEHMNQKQLIDDTHHNHPFSSSALPAKSTIENKVPLLVDSFLDPIHDLEQPDSIVSRWRPTLDEILVERDLLYCLIQYLKGHRALEYLQAVLDDSPDGNVYCRKVLQLEYLSGFCRSKFFMESLGISQVDFALEAGNDSPGSKRRHIRSSSYGGVNSGIQIWKLGDPKAIDGLPIHNNPVSIGGGGGAGTTEPDLFKRRPHSIEVVIKKFLMSATKPENFHHSRPNDIKESKAATCPQPKRRVGINPKSYEDLAKEDVISQLIVAPCDIYDCTSEVAISWMNGQYWLQPIMLGWAQLARRYLKAPVENAIKSQLSNFLSLETLVVCIDLVTEAFQSFLTTTNDSITTEQQVTAPQEPETSSSSSQPKSSQQQQHPEENNTINDSTAKIKESLVAALHWFFNEIVDAKTFARCLNDNEDEIMLFFVDLLDLLVTEVTAGE